ncbi:MAG: amidophosphoribosyltransferase [Elusimicrobiota bacterium]
MCGIFGIYNNRDAAHIAYLGLYGLQHRGQESAGIVTSDGKRLNRKVGVGLVAEIFKDKALDSLPGNIAIGHTRYSTAGSDPQRDAQPILVKYCKEVGDIAIAHNGNLLNSDVLREQLKGYGCEFLTTSDTEVIPVLLTKGWTNSLVHDLPWTLRQVKGAYSLLLITKDSIVAVRDPNGIRPLCIGKLGESVVFSSETCTFGLVGAKFLRELDPGEILVVNKKGMNSTYFTDAKKRLKTPSAFCIFEYIYFSRPDSTIFGKNVHEVRKRLGEELVKESNVPADIVVPIPDSANSTAMGYAQTAKLPFEAGLIRNHYIGRTFIQPHQSIRDFRAKIKYNPIEEVIRGKRIVVVDDSIVRGTTSRKLMRMIRDAGAKEIHLRISCPEIKHPCFYGIDTPTEEELIAANNTVEKIKGYLEVDSLHFLSLEGMIKATGIDKKTFCTACFTGKYPLK